jgi:hypothetical protein
MAYFVSRQAVWGTGAFVVEIAGSLDTSGPDAYSPPYEGEVESYNDPREAVEAAISIRDSWRVDRQGKQDPSPEDIFLDSDEEGEDDDATTRAWAVQEWQQLPQCDHCGKSLPEKRKRWHLADDCTGEEFCSQECADKATEFVEQENEHMLREEQRRIAESQEELADCLCDEDDE